MAAELDNSAPSWWSVRPWLPDFCRLPVLFWVVVAVEVAVLTGVLVRLPTVPQAWTSLFTASLFAQWLATLSVGALCRARPWLDRQPLLRSVLLALAIPVAVALVGASFTVMVDHVLGAGWTVPREDALAFVLACAAVALLLGAALLRYFYVSEQWRVQVAAHAQAEVRALQARIKPHFLFNSMNSIASLVRHDPHTAERAIEDLADLFRAALGAGHGESTLGEELQLAERFLAIEQLRLGERLRTQWSLPGDLPRDLPMPRLILQPLVENAVIHGVARLDSGGTIEIGARVDGQVLRVDIRNPYPAELSPREDGNRHAQNSIAQRLKHRFGTLAHMTTDAREGYYGVTLWLPLEGARAGM